MAGTNEVSVALVTTWNAKCGVANYSKYLVSHTRADAGIDYRVFARKEDVLVEEDGSNVTRCWLNHGDISDLVQSVGSSGVNVANIMFNFSFFAPEQLATIVLSLLEHGVHVVVTVHDSVGTVSDIHAALRLADAVVVFTEDDRRLLSERGVSGAIMLPQGILNYPDEDQRAARQRWAVPNSKVIASAGFLLPDKGVLEVIRALPALLAAYPDILYLVVCPLYPLESSSETYFAECRDAVQELGVGDHVRFEVQYRPELEVMGLLHTADMIVMPRKATIQPTSAGVRFALSALRSVITTNAPIVREFGTEVYKIASSDPTLICEAVKTLYADQALCTAMIEATKRRIAADSWESVSRKHTEVVRSVLGIPLGERLRFVPLAHELIAERARRISAEDQRRVAEAQQRAAEDQQRAAEAQQRVAEAQQRAAEDQQRAAEDQQRAAEDQQRAAEDQLRDVLVSTSWRLTSPLRWGVHLMYKLAVRSAPFTHPATQRALQFLVRHQKARGFALRFGSRFPAVKAGLMGLAGTNVQYGPTQPHRLRQCETREHLTESARLIYDNLKQAQAFTNAEEDAAAH